MVYETGMIQDLFALSFKWFFKKKKFDKRIFFIRVFVGELKGVFFLINLFRSAFTVENLSCLDVYWKENFLELNWEII